ncbi:MGMT family protein, partial [Candidatus Bipolaricaulota bacterium]|nr:MGMT family protein [Candidatus Bipolaricaulota bacterium]
MRSMLYICSSNGTLLLMCELRNGDGVKPGLYTQIYDIVRQIQRGRVATYGQIAYV